MHIDACVIHLYIVAAGKVNGLDVILVRVRELSKEHKRVRPVAEHRVDDD